MALPPIVVSLYPNVPQLPGVPQLVRSPLFPPSPAPTLGSGQAQSTLATSANNQTPTWGICDSSLNPVVTPDSILNFGQRNEARISNFPVQDGGFSSFNKVFLPFELSVGMSKGSDLAGREQFLSDIETVFRSYGLFTILTPEKTYTNCNVHRYEVGRRDSKAAYFLTDVEVFFTQIVQVSAQYSTTTANTQNAQNPASVSPVNQGSVQAKPVDDPFDLTAGTGPANTVFSSIGPPSTELFPVTNQFGGH